MEKAVHAIIESLCQYKSLNGHVTLPFPVRGKHIQLVQYAFNVIVWFVQVPRDFQT